MTRARRASLVVAAILAAVSPSHSAEDGAEILRRAEEIRNPDIEFAVDFRIRSVSGKEKRYEWDASYSMIAGGSDKTIILMRTPMQFYGGLVLMAEGRYWMMLPRATKPMELSEAQVLRGDVSSGDLARSTLTRGYDVALAGVERLDGESCWKLDLTRSERSSRYSRILYWVAKKGYQPRRLDYYGNTGHLLRSIRLTDYRKGPLGVRSMTLEIGTFGEWEDRTVLTFSNLRRIKTGRIEFRVEAMDAIRRAALAVRDAGQGSDLPLEGILAAVEPSPVVERGP